MVRVNRALQVVGILYIDIGRGPAFDYGKARYDSAVGAFYAPVSLTISDAKVDISVYFASSLAAGLAK